MTYGIGARQDFTAYHHKNSSRKNISQNVFGGAALACIVLGCAWTLTANVLGTGANPAAVSANVEPVTGGAVTFSARFDALGAGAEGLSVVRKSAPVVAKASDAIRKTYMALLDVTYSLGPPPGSFSATMPRGPDRQLAMLPPDQSGAEDVAPVAPLAAQRAAESVPLPASRPSTLRLLASREVAKAKAAILAVPPPRSRRSSKSCTASRSSDKRDQWHSRSCSCHERQRCGAGTLTQNISALDIRFDPEQPPVFGGGVGFPTDFRKIILQQGAEIVCLDYIREKSVGATQFVQVNPRCDASRARQYRHPSLVGTE